MKRVLKCEVKLVKVRRTCFTSVGELAKVVRGELEMRRNPQIAEIRLLSLTLQRCPRADCQRIFHFRIVRWQCSLCTKIVCNSGFIPSDWIDLVANHNGRKTEFFLYLMIKLPVSSARSYYWLFGSFGVISAICVTIDDRSRAKSTDLESVHFICSSCCHNCRLLFFI